MAVVRALLSLSILGLILYYLWRRLVRDTSLRGPARLAATTALVLLVLPMMWVNVTGGGGAPKVTGGFAWPTFIGWALFALAFVGVLASDIVRLFVWLARRALRAPKLDLSRRQALARITGGVISTAVIGHAGLGATRALGDAEVVDVPVTLHRLPRALDGFTIVQLTDIHIGGTIGRRFVEEMVARTNAIGGDLIALTGDFVDDSVDQLRDAVAPLGELRARHGVYFVTGNHEYYAGAEPWLAHFRSLGIRVLRNERVEITRDGAAFDLVGIEDHSRRPDLGPVLVGRDQTRALVVLAHQPRQVRMTAKHDVDLQLSGHTHGGQVWPWHYLVSLQQGGLLAGRYRVGQTQLYVSRGTGYWGPPIRAGAPPEITRVILRAPAPPSLG